MGPVDAKDILQFAGTATIALLLYLQTRKGSKDTIASTVYQLIEKRLTQETANVDRLEDLLYKERDDAITARRLAWEELEGARKEKHGQAAIHQTEVMRLQLEILKLQDAIDHAVIVADRQKKRIEDGKASIEILKTILLEAGLKVPELPSDIHDNEVK